MRSVRAARTYAPAPPAGANEKTSSSSPASRDSAWTWSYTKRPSAGRSGVGYMLVTIRARMTGEPTSATIPYVPHVLPQQPVAVFDSGVGGLTVLHELLVSLPTEDYLYLGDTARFPYGTRTQAELQSFAIEIAEHLLRDGAKLLVVACNAASSAALGALERHIA